MKRSTLLQHLRRHGCYLKREGSAHSLWANPDTGAIEAVPRHTEIPNRLGQKICRTYRFPKLEKSEICLTTGLRQTFVPRLYGRDSAA